MTADNWATCPKCYQEEEVRLEQATDDVGSSYGRVPQYEWLKMFNDLTQPEVDFDLREDYEIGFGADGIFHILYECRCAKCGFEFEFRSPR